MGLRALTEPPGAYQGTRHPESTGLASRRAALDITCAVKRSLTAAPLGQWHDPDVGDLDRYVTRVVDGLLDAVAIFCSDATNGKS